ncbi:MAG: M20 family metallopeptidase [Polyangiaceae bacterium]|nr:M20 family metallopeptidase [Polyangiaceae bacterium]
MIEELEQFLHERQDAAISLLERLVEQNSFTDNREGGAVVGEMLAAELRSIAGISSVRTIPSDRFAPHLVATTNAARSDFVALVGHLDTVFPPGTFEGFRRDGALIRGPGVLDMKGGLVVILEALRALSHVGILPSLPVRLVIVSDEEVGSPEGRGVIERELAGARAALVFEAGRAQDAIITSRRGTGSGRAVATGRAAHSGNAHAEGANAIRALCRFVEYAEELTDYARGITVNVGIIRGGTSKNTVPDHAEALMDLRYERLVDGEWLIAALEDAARRAAISGTSITLGTQLARPPLERTAANVALYQAYAACARAAGLGDGEAPLVGGGSDAATTAAMGIASIDGLGPRGAGFHTHDERVEVATIVPKAQALARFLMQAGN